jgi:hypothetical protein
LQLPENVIVGEGTFPLLMHLSILEGCARNIQYKADGSRHLDPFALLQNLYNLAFGESCLFHLADEN